MSTVATGSRSHFSLPRSRGPRRYARLPARLARGWRCDDGRRPPLSLAGRAEERGSLRLHDPADRRRAAVRAGVAFAIVNPVMVLVAPRLVQGVAVRAVAERRPF